MVNLSSYTFALVAILASSKLGFGGESRVSGGLSPNGKIEVVVVEKKNAEDFEPKYEFILRELESKNQLLKVSEAGYPHTIYAAVDNDYTVNSSVLWDADSDAFAFNLRDTKRSRSTSVFALRSGKWQEVPLKDPFPQIFKDLQIKEVNRCAYTDPLRWEGKNMLVLKSSGDCALPDGRWFEYEVKYNLSALDKFVIKRTALWDRNG